MPVHPSRLHVLNSFLLGSALLGLVWIVGGATFARAADPSPSRAATPPMGWNDWAHYRCDFTADTILANANALVRTGLAARGFNTVTIDDCWMLKDRDASGNLQVDPQRFPHGMPPVAQAVHALGLNFGIYEDAGFETCGRFAGSGVPNGGGKDHFLQDTRLFASWGVDYLKLDGCNVYVPKGSSDIEAYRKAYEAQSAAIKAVGRPMVFSESAPAYFQDTPEWYDVLRWVSGYGQLWREGTDMATYHSRRSGRDRFPSVLWNYAYNLPLGRFQTPGNWNDPDFIIGGDAGLTLTESRSQMTLWAMMAAPLILSSNVDALSPQAVTILGNAQVIAVDQDALGRMANLVRRSAVMDVLFKPLAGGDFAVAVLNRGAASLPVDLHPADLGFADSACRFDARDLWSGADQSQVSVLHANLDAHDTVLWRLHPAASCGDPSRTGTITMINPGTNPKTNGGRRRDIQTYSLCLGAPGSVGPCTGTSQEAWTVTPGRSLKSAGGLCLAVAAGKPTMSACATGKDQRWNYTLEGNLVSAKNHQCLTADGATSPENGSQGLTLKACGHNQPDQIWSLPN